MEKYILTNGRIIEVFESDMQGMSGEPMLTLNFSDDHNNMITLSSIEHLLSLKDKKEINDLSDSLTESNHDLAVAWCI